jgi:hypothetical protein
MPTYRRIDAFTCPSCEFAEVVEQSVQKRKAKRSVHSCSEDKDHTLVHLLGTAGGIRGHGVLPELESSSPLQREPTRSISIPVVFQAGAKLLTWERVTVGQQAVPLTCRIMAGLYADCVPPYNCDPRSHHWNV